MHALEILKKKSKQATTQPTSQWENIRGSHAFIHAWTFLLEHIDQIL